MKNYKELIGSYFNCWLLQDETELSILFHPNCMYVESFGPCYLGLEEVITWFQNWNKYSKVLAWDIYHVYEIENIAVCEWYFKYRKENLNVEEFNGVSIVEFNEQNQIISLKEFGSALPNYLPLQCKKQIDVYEKNR